MINNEIKELIKENDLFKVKKLTELFDTTNQDICDMIAIAANNCSFTVLQYLLENNEIDPEIMDQENIKLNKPIDITSYDHARFLITKQLLEKYNIKYLL